MNFRYTLILFLFSYSCLTSQSLLHTDGKAIVNASGDTVILKTMNLGGWMLIEPYQLQSAGFASAQWEFEEKIEQMDANAPAIERLGVPAFTYQGEALHGLAEAQGGRLMQATSFPQSIAMGSTWNPSLMKKVANAISDEARAFYDKYYKQVAPTCYKYGIDPVFALIVGVVETRWGESSLFLKT